MSNPAYPLCILLLPFSVPILPLLGQLQLPMFLLDPSSRWRCLHQHEHADACLYSFCESGCASNGITDAVTNRLMYLRTAITIHVYH